MSFTYRHGDRPLEGYTILRGIGRGGFGEVYYAVSDGGREVALKSIHQNREIELRGVRQCMNLKCPRLVTIFDVHENAYPPGTSGPPFIVMEYIEGPSLRDLLEQSPGGVSEEKAAFLVGEIARGLAYLHERGIVHRDLKPENLFYEDGYVKIGDYGLSKFISVSRQSGQTISVGTVHYMAPEIGTGNYQRGIDLYALGVILYELLTGRVPFDGRTMGEILMKHLSAEPDVSGLSPAFQRVVRRALRKKHEDRYDDASALSADIVADGDLGDRVARLGPADFSQYTARHVREADAAPPAALGSRRILAGDTASVGPAAAAAAPGERPPRVAPAPPVPVAAPAAPSAEVARASKRARVKERLARLASGEKGTRTLLFAVTVLASSMLLHFLVALPMSGATSALFFLGSIVAGAASVLLVESWAAARFGLEGGFARRCAVTIAGASFLVPGYAVLVLAGSSTESVYAYLPPVLAGLFCIDWRDRVRRDRAERLLLGPAFGAAVAGFLLSLLLGADTPLAVAGILAGISLALNVGAPFAAGKVAPALAAGGTSAGKKAPRDGKGAARGIEAFGENVAQAVDSAPSVWESVVELKERMRIAARSSPQVQLIRPRREAVLGGVCAGLARYMDVSAIAVRVTFFLFAILTWGWALLAYLIFWIKLPAAEGFEITPRTAAAAVPRPCRAVRAALSSSSMSYLLMVLGLGGGLTLLLGAAAGGRDLLGLGVDPGVAFIAGCFLLTVAVYRLLEVLRPGPHVVWRSLLGGVVYLALVSTGLLAVRTLVARELPGAWSALTGWDLAIIWAVILLAARLAVEAPGLFLTALSPASRDSDPGQPPRAAAWGLLGTTLVLAGMLIALVGVATTTGLAEAVFLKLKIERYSAFIAFGGHREHFLIGLVLFLPGLFCHLAARRWGGGPHVLRGTMGLVGAGLAFGAVALFAPEYIHVGPDFDVVLAHALSVESLLTLYLLLVLSFGCLKWPGRSVQWKAAAPLATKEFGLPPTACLLVLAIVLAAGDGTLRGADAALDSGIPIDAGGDPMLQYHAPDDLAAWTAMEVLIPEAGDPRRWIEDVGGSSPWEDRRGDLWVKGRRPGPRGELVGYSRLEADRDGAARGARESAVRQIAALAIWSVRDRITRHRLVDFEAISKLAEAEAAKAFGPARVDGFEQSVDRPYGRLHRAAVLVRMEEKSLRKIGARLEKEIERAEARARAERRVLIWKGGIAAAFTLLTAIGYLAVNALTRGYFTWRLRALSLLALGAGYAALALG